MKENGEWKRLHNKELHSLYRLSNIVWVITSTDLSRVGHIARMKEGRITFNVLTGRPTGEEPLGRSRHRKKTILEWILKK